MLRVSLTSQLLVHRLQSRILVLDLFRNSNQMTRKYLDWISLESSSFNAVTYSHGFVCQSSSGIFDAYSHKYVAVFLPPLSHFNAKCLPCSVKVAEREGVL